IRDFEYSRVEERKDTKWTAVKDSELMRTWIVKRTVVTYERLPGILRSTQIISTSPPIYVNPLRRSVDQMQRKNAELMETALLVLLNRIHAVKKLSGEILGVVRPAVMGGVSNYEVEILEFCLYAHATRTEITKQFHDHLVEGFFEHKQYVEDKFGRTLNRHIELEIAWSCNRIHNVEHVDHLEEVQLECGGELYIVAFVN
ncbi:hypothetical protein TELCIR_22927, partial [Teladorsagia circumcincta]